MSRLITLTNKWSLKIQLWWWHEGN